MFKLLTNSLTTRLTNTAAGLGLLRLAQRSLDAVVLGAAFILAYLLRFDFSLAQFEIFQTLAQMILVVILEMCVLRLFGIHKFIWRYTSMRETKHILTALLCAAIPLLLLRFCLVSLLGYWVVPISIIIFNFCLASIGLLGLRLLRREIYEQNHRSRTIAAIGGRKERVLLIGAGRAGVMTLAEIKGRGDINLDVIGFVDDDRLKKGAVINGVKVLGTTGQLSELVRGHQIDHVIISLAQASREDFHRILDICQQTPIRVRAIPGLFELLQEKVTVSRIRDVEIEDLLGRPAVQLEESSIRTFLQGKTVMVTGAGGSIGSELVRQLSGCRTKNLVLVERSEFALFQIEREIGQNYPEIDFTPVIADVCDAERMTKVFEKFCPQVVFHAAAHKHVPMMELNASEALKNNVLGTNNVGGLAGRFGAESFVFVSTDKAVNPTSVMGASKRVAELVIQNLNNQFRTRFVAVRFGNVIGSNGSVIPTFREQIRKGGPVTVTHPEMMRFFMTIPEATQLVMQAGALARGGEIFILDMGKPVRILDLARETIKLSGMIPEVDIPIVFTGIRPGEKLVEELETDQERLSKTIHPKIFIGEIAPYPALTIKKMLGEIKDLCLSEDDLLIRAFLSKYLPEANLEGITVKSWAAAANLSPGKQEGCENSRLVTASAP